ncbi:glycosyltransferase involved in cell wall biosynthesis [Pedobacter cryoconitis]|uniref:glycosyltransferase family 4 protein n=1 Tax=Pedobacter cryoconitis TaxID=188932 RepID=UPI0016114C8F|nr:glycosyltransferase family 4 protein [Pedobacter cryoconitis]MBB6271535.1 glycosyltransferase involved in cell wall biosynthesis [Pedobacter cryoconitis]
MKILHTVESYLPSRHGMQEVVTQLSESLVKMGHDVTIATSYNEHRSTEIIGGVKIVGFKIKGNFVTGITGETVQYQEFLRSNQFDVITNFAAQQWATDLMLPILGDLSAKKVFVPTGFSALNNPAYSTYFENMKTWIKGYDSNVFLSDNYRDINFSRKYVNSIQIIPNGANQKEFQDIENINIRELIGVSADTKLILTVGSHTGYKGHAEAIKIFNQANISNAVLLIIGNLTSMDGRLKSLLKGILNLFGIIRSNCSLACKLGALKHNLLNKKNTVIVKQLSRAATVNAYKQADVFLFPSLIECSPIVLFEAMAGSTPFLVTDVGNAKEIINWTNGGKLLPTEIDDKGYSIVNIGKAAKLLTEFAASSGEMISYGNNGHSAFIDKFTWEKIAGRYEELYLNLINN